MLLLTPFASQQYFLALVRYHCRYMKLKRPEEMLITKNNTITLNTLSEGTYSDCTISVTGSTGNVSSSHTITSFTVVIRPVISEVTAVISPTIDTTPNFTFSSSKAGTITYGGSCSSSTTVAVAGNNTITFNALTNGTYDDCTIRVTGN